MGNGKLYDFGRVKALSRIDIKYFGYNSELSEVDGFKPELYRLLYAFKINKQKLDKWIKL